MKVGGNGSATDFFTRHGGASLLNDSDIKRKYTSRVAELYKEELARRVKEDVTQCAYIYLPWHPLSTYCVVNSTHTGSRTVSSPTVSLRPKPLLSPMPQPMKMTFSPLGTNLLHQNPRLSTPHRPLRHR